MRRTLVGLTIVMLALLLLAMPGLAEGPQAHGGMGPGHGQGTTVFSLHGCITDIDDGAETFEVRVVKSMKGVDLPLSATIYTEETTRFFEWIEEVQYPISFEDLDVDDPVTVNGQILEGDELWATQVTVNPDCPALEGECD